MSKEPQMPIEDYCDLLEALTNQGDTINADGLRKWIERYAKESNRKILIDCANFIQPYDDGDGEATRLMKELDKLID